MRYDPRDTEGGRSAEPATRFAVRTARSRSGHRREATGRKDPRRPFQDRLDGALVDVGIHRAVAYRDLVDAHFGGHPYAGRRGVDKLKRAGLLEEHKAKGPKGEPFTVLTATREGAALARTLARKRGYHRRQEAWAGLGREPDLVHDVAIYRAVRDVRDRLAGEGRGSVSRIRLDAELRRAVNGRAERVRATHGAEATERERRRVAEDLGLPVRNDGRVLYPDAQIEHAGDGRDPGRVNIEIATEHYREGAVATKALAGFAVYAANNAAGRTVASGLARAARSLARSGDSGGGGAAGRRDDPASVEL